MIANKNRYIQLNLHFKNHKTQLNFHLKKYFSFKTMKLNLNSKNFKNGNSVLKILKIYFQKTNSFINKIKIIKT